MIRATCALCPMPSFHLRHRFECECHPLRWPSVATTVGPRRRGDLVKQVPNGSHGSYTIHTHSQSGLEISCLQLYPVRWHQSWGSPKPKVMDKTDRTFRKSKWNARSNKQCELLSGFFSFQIRRGCIHGHPRTCKHTPSCCFVQAHTRTNILVCKCHAVPRSTVATLQSLKVCLSTQIHGNLTTWCDPGWMVLFVLLRLWVFNFQIKRWCPSSA